MSSTGFFVRFTKVKNNKLLNRVQMVVDVFHPNESKVTKEQIKEKIKDKFKKSHISLFGVKKFFGGGRTQGFCLVYDTEEAMKRYEPPSRLRRQEVDKLPPKDRKKAQLKKEGRKVKKVKKNQALKKRGTKKRQDKILLQKQNKKKKAK